MGIFSVRRKYSVLWLWSGLELQAKSSVPNIKTFCLDPIILNTFLEIILFLQFPYPYISSIGKFVVFNGILLYLTNIYEEATIGYINVNSSSKSMPLDFKPIDIDLPPKVVSTSNCFLHSQNCSNPSEKNVFLDDFDFRLHVFSGYRK